MRLTLRAAVAALSLAVAAPLVAPSTAAAQQAPRLAYVDVAQVMEQVPGRAEATQQFEREATGIRAELQRMQDSLQAMVQSYQRTTASLTAAQRTAREKELQGKQQEYQQRAQALQERGQAREQELANTFETLVRDAINDVRAADGYAMIFASGANSAMLAADRSLDVTDKVLARMRTIAASRPAGARPATSTGAPVAAPAGVARPKTPPGN